MANPQHQILLGEAEGPWRKALADRLQRENHPLRLTEDGEEIRRALVDQENPPKVVLIGQQLKGMGGLEALYQASRELGEEKGQRVPWPVRAVLLVTDARSDIELLDLLRQRGVSDFVYRDDPVEKTVAKIVNNLFADRRPSHRNVVRVDATVTIRGSKANGSLYDLHLSGAQVVVAENDLPVAPSTGEVIEVEFGFGNAKVRCPAEVRRLSSSKSFFGDRLVMGLQFSPLGEAERSALERVLQGAMEEIEMARRG